MQSYRLGFTLLELAIVIVVLIILVAMLLPAHSHHNRAPMTQNSSQQRGVITALILYASSNKDQYPGFGRPDENEDGFTDIDMPPLQDGTDTGLTSGAAVQTRYYELLKRNLFTGDLLINPFETKTVWTTGGVDTQHYSYAMLHIGKETPAERATEWGLGGATGDAIVVSDRNIAREQGNHETDPKFVQSIQSNRVGRWEGVFGFNDNHVEQLDEPVTETRYGQMKITKYAGHGFTTPGDYLFDVGETDDDGVTVGDFDTGTGAVMVYDGTSVGTP